MLFSGTYNLRRLNTSWNIFPFGKVANAKVTFTGVFDIFVHQSGCTKVASAAQIMIPLGCAVLLIGKQPTPLFMFW